MRVTADQQRNAGIKLQSIADEYQGDKPSPGQQTGAQARNYDSSPYSRAIPRLLRPARCER